MHLLTLSPHVTKTKKIKTLSELWQRKQAISLQLQLQQYVYAYWSWTRKCNCYSTSGKWSGFALLYISISASRQHTSTPTEIRIIAGNCLQFAGSSARIHKIQMRVQRYRYTVSELMICFVNRGRRQLTNAFQLFDQPSKRNAFVNAQAHRPVDF